MPFLSQLSSFNRTIQLGGVNFIEIDAGSFHNLACLNGSGSTLIRQVDVRPSGEAFFKIPLALSVPEEYQFKRQLLPPAQQEQRSKNAEERSEAVTAVKKSLFIVCPGLIEL